MLPKSGRFDMFRQPRHKQKNLNLSEVWKKVLSVKKIIIDEGFCKGCGLCIEACPKKLLKMGKKLSKQGYPLVEIGTSDQTRCLSCALCARVCPDVALKITKNHV
jgi:2-oxoglutarate ferredoxin oxidoreductase subunit delta